MVECSVCNASFETRRGLANHMRGSCGKKQAESSAAIMEKRRKGREILLAAKIQRQDDENAALRERELIRESTTEGEDEPFDIPVSCPLHNLSDHSNNLFA
jgi:hypothetical protein